MQRRTASFAYALLWFAACCFAPLAVADPPNPWANVDDWVVSDIRSLPRLGEEELKPRVFYLLYRGVVGDGLLPIDNPDVHDLERDRKTISDESRAYIFVRLLDYPDERIRRVAFEAWLNAPSAIHDAIAAGRVREGATETRPPASDGCGDDLAEDE